MSYHVDCDKCGESVDIRGYSGHLRMAHGINGEEMRKLVEKKKAYTQPSETTDAGTQATQQTTGYSHASQISAQAKQNESVGACTMCGRSEDVRQADKVAKLFSQRGYRVPDELSEYEYYCPDCEYAFGGENDE